MEALFCAYRTLSVPNTPPVRIHLRGLDPETWYKTENGAVYHGSVLMNHGLTVPLKGDFSSCVLHFQAVPEER